MLKYTYLSNRTRSLIHKLDLADAEDRPDVANDLCRRLNYDIFHLDMKASEALQNLPAADADHKWATEFAPHTSAARVEARAIMRHYQLMPAEELAGFPPLWNDDPEWVRKVYRRGIEIIDAYGNAAARVIRARHARDTTAISALDHDHITAALNDAACAHQAFESHIRYVDVVDPCPGPDESADTTVIKLVNRWIAGIQDTTIPGKNPLEPWQTRDDHPHVAARWDAIRSVLEDRSQRRLVRNRATGVYLEVDVVHTR